MDSRRLRSALALASLGLLIACLLLAVLRAGQVRGHADHDRKEAAHGLAADAAPGLVVIESAQSRDSEPIQLAATREIEVRVSSTQGDPVPNALVYPSRPMQTHARIVDAATCGRDGRARVLVGQDAVGVTVRASGFRPSYFPLRRDVDAYEVTLDTGRRLRGQVIDPLTQKPIPGVRVFACPPTDHVAFRGANRQTLYVGAGASGGHALTGKGGAFEIGGLPPEDLVVWASKRNWIPRLSLMEVPADQDEVTIDLFPTYGLVLQFRDAVTGEDIAPLIPACRIEVPPGTIADPVHLARANEVMSGGGQPKKAHSHLRYSFRPFPNLAWLPPVLDEASVRLDVECIGYEPKRDSVTLRPGALVRHALDLHPRDNLRDVSLHAVAPSDEPYSGALEVEFLAGSRVMGRAVLSFRDGVAGTSLRLPMQTLWFRPRGVASVPTDTPQTFWDPAGPSQQIDLSAGVGPARATLQLRGGPVLLTVLSPDRVPVRGYSVSRKVGRQWIQEPLWDFYRLAATPPADEALASRIWFPPGAHELRVELGGVGSAHVTFDVEHDSPEIALEVELEQE